MGAGESMMRAAAATTRSVAFLAVLVAPGLAHAAPDDGFAMSNDGALLGGAAVVRGRDAASVWYNPASIAATRTLRFDAAANAYGARLTRAPRAIAVRGGSQPRHGELRESMIGVVPTAVSFAFAPAGRRLVLAAHLHTPRYADIEVRQDLDVRGEGADPRPHRIEVDTIALHRRYHAGLSLGMAPSADFRFGVGVGTVYDRQLGLQRLSIVVPPDDGPTEATLAGVSDPATRLLGLELVLGLQGRLARWLEGGVTLRSPAPVIWGRLEGGSTVSVELVDEDGTSTAEAANEPAIEGSAPRWMTPLVVATGLAVVQPRWELELDLEGATASLVHSEEWATRARWDVRLGALVHLHPRWTIGAGVFTDRSDVATVGPYPRLRLDRYGATVGARLRTPVRLASTERAGKLRFETTLALRYAAGVGEVAQIAVELAPGHPAISGFDIDGSTRVAQLLVSVHVGTGFAF